MLNDQSSFKMSNKLKILQKRYLFAWPYKRKPSQYKYFIPTMTIKIAKRDHIYAIA